MTNGPIKRYKSHKSLTANQHERAAHSSETIARSAAFVLGKDHPTTKKAKADAKRHREAAKKKYDSKRKKPAPNQY